ncbi:MAG: cyclic nucleotide-binding domain-containing protein [Cytophagales bacterium]|nr:cyclic nucleotide-binding domain-containing protein [Cytophagales bacterium]
MFDFLKKSQDKELVDVINFLSQNKFFKKLTKKELALLHSYLFLRKYRKDEVVFFRGDPSEAIYLVQSGEVMLSTDIREGFEQVAVLKEGHIFGENAFIANTKRMFNAIVTSKAALLYMLPSIKAMDIFEKNKELHLKIMISLASSYNEQILKLIEAYKEAPGLFNFPAVSH